MRSPARIGGWDIEGLLGAGGVAEVFRGRGGANVSRPDVAIKRIAPEHARLEELGPLHLAALRAEGALLARIAHPNVIHLVETIEDPPALVLELLSGRTLTEVCAQARVPL